MAGKFPRNFSADWIAADLALRERLLAEVTQQAGRRHKGFLITKETKQLGLKRNIRRTPADMKPKLISCALGFIVVCAASGSLRADDRLASWNGLENDFPAHWPRAIRLVTRL